VRPLLTWTRERPVDFVFLVGFLCRHRAGEVALSDEHVEHAWVTASSWRALALAPGYAGALERIWSLLQPV
jgi:hypothetical protein